MNKIKHFLTTNSLNFPKQTIVLFLLLNAFLIIGIPYIVQDDDMVKLLPRNIGAVTTFEDIREEFGNSEFMYIGIGHKNLDAFNPDLLQIVWEISEELEEFEPIEEVISISTASKIYFEKLDSSIVVDDLMPQKSVNSNQLNSMVQYLNENQQLKINIVSKNQDFHNIVVRPRSNDKYADITYKIHEITDKYSSYNNNGIITQLDYHYGGQAYVTGAVPALVSSEVKVLVLYGLILMCLILLINLRNVPAVTLIISIISIINLSQVTCGKSTRLSVRKEYSGLILRG